MGSDELYPYERDYAWLASDAVGHVAIFTTAGKGPIPVAVLADREVADRAELLVKGLPERGNYRMLVTLPRPDDFAAFARRGLFAYDWQDCHRTTELLRRYELLSRPDLPVTAEELDGAVATLIRKVKFESIRFADSRAIAVGDHVESRGA